MSTEKDLNKKIDDLTYLAMYLMDCGIADVGNIIDTAEAFEITDLNDLDDYLYCGENNKSESSLLYAIYSKAAQDAGFDSDEFDIYINSLDSHLYIKCPLFDDDCIEVYNKENLIELKEKKEKILNEQNNSEGDN